MKKYSLLTTIGVLSVLLCSTHTSLHSISDKAMIRFWRLLGNKKISAEEFNEFLSRYTGVAGVFMREKTKEEQIERYRTLNIAIETLFIPEKPEAAVEEYEHYLLVPDVKTFSVSNAINTLLHALTIENIAGISSASQIKDFYAPNAQTTWKLYQLGTRFQGLRFGTAVSSLQNEEKLFTFREAICFFLQYEEAITDESTFQLICAGSRIVKNDERRIPVFHIYRGEVKLIAMKEQDAYVLGMIGLATTYDYQFAYFESLYSE